MENFTGNVNDFNSASDVEVVNIDEIAPKYRKIFQYPYFNKVQSMVIPDVLYSDKSIVVSAPTGSGKTVILELAIIRLLMNLDQLKYEGDFKIVYMAPVKALCTERLMDWYGKFSQLGLPCIEVTGDTDLLDIGNLKSYKIIMTTPEKWDSLTRRWKDHELIVQMVKLFLIDEVHLLKEDVRGPVLEAVVSRMKTIQESLNLSTAHNNSINNTSVLSLNIRFIAISATIPNAQDIAEWLGTRQQRASYFVIGEEFRPVQLIKVVEGFPCKDGLGLFKFDMGLSYKIRPIIERHCEGKPTLIFCNTRKSVEMTADILSKELLFQFTDEQREIFFAMSNQLTDKKLQKLVRSGIGCHHAGFIQHDRNIVEDMFRQGDLPVLITTSTLAMGVNLPAHLVIIKTTQYYNNGTYQEYEESTVLQMMGRAGRPQFDNQGIAVIMTRNQDKDRYVRLVGGQRAIESSLHRHLSEHLNAEVALGTLPDLLQAMDWIRSTFLYVRAVKNPTHYGFPSHNNRDTIEKRLEELCLKCMNALARAGMLLMDSNTRVESTEAGRVMAANCLDFETMKLIMKIKGSESLSELIEVLSKCHEFGDLPLRSGEKRTLNLLNRKPRGQDGAVCRFPQRGRIQSRDMKINCLIQAMFGCLPVPDPSLHQEVIKISRMGEHLSKCIMKYLTRPSSIGGDQQIYKAVLNSVILSKCFIAKLWENSPYVTRQFTGIGATFASLLASSGKTTIQSILESNPRDIERILSKQPPTGNLLKKQVSLLPAYNLKVSVIKSRTILLTFSISNAEELVNKGSTAGDKHRISLIVGDSENNLLLYENIADSSLLHGPTFTLSKEIIPTVQESHTVYAHCISHTWVGIDVNCNLEVKKSLNSILGPLQRSIMNYAEKTQTKGNAVCHKDQDTNSIILSPTTQNSFMTDMCEEKTGKKKNNRISKPNEKKTCDKSVSKINSFIKTIPEPSQLSTLSSNVSYYKPLPKQTKQVNKDHNIPNPSPELNTSFNLGEDYENTISLQTFNNRTPEYIEKYYSRNNDNCFDNWCMNLQKQTNEPSTPAMSNEYYAENSNVFNSDMPTTCYREIDSFDQRFSSTHESASQITDVELENDNICGKSPLTFENDLLKINEEYETFVLDKIDDIPNIQQTTNKLSKLREDTLPINNSDDKSHKTIDVSEIDDREIENQMNIVAQNIDKNSHPTKNLKTASKTVCKKDNTINTYFKQSKKSNNSPNAKRIKLDIQYTSPQTKSCEENVMELIESSPVTQHKSKFSKFCTGQNKPNENIASTGESKLKSVGTNTDPETRNMVDSQQQTSSSQATNIDYENVMAVTQYGYNQISKLHKADNPVTQKINMLSDNKDFTRETHKAIKPLQDLPSKNEFKINVQINVNNTYNQIFLQSDSPMSSNFQPRNSTFTPLEDMRASKQTTFVKNKSVTWSEPLIKCIAEDQNALQIESKDCTMEGNNTNPIQLLKRSAISKIKEKMQNICEIKNIPTNIKLNFMNAIKSITNLSSDEFMELYSIEKLNALQNIGNNCLKGNSQISDSCEQLTNQGCSVNGDLIISKNITESNLSCVELKKPDVEYSDVTEHPLINPKDIIPNQICEQSTNQGSSVNTDMVISENITESNLSYNSLNSVEDPKKLEVDTSNVIEHPLVNAKDIIPNQIHETIEDDTNKYDTANIRTNNLEIIKEDSNEKDTKFNSNILKKPDQTIKHRQENERAQMKSNHKKDNELIFNRLSYKNEEHMNNPKANNLSMPQTQSTKSTVNDLTNDDLNNMDIASILHKYATSNASKSKYVKNITSTERSNCDRNMTNVKKYISPSQHQTSISTFLDFASHKEIPKYYQVNNSQTLNPPSKRSYMQNAFQSYKFDNQDEGVFQIQDNSTDDDMSEILEENILNLDSEHQSNFEDNELDENIFNPLRVLPSSYSENNLESENKQEIIYLENFENEFENITQDHRGIENDINASNTYFEDNLPSTRRNTNNAISRNYVNGDSINIFPYQNSSNIASSGPISRKAIFNHIQQYKTTPKNTLRH